MKTAFFDIDTQIDFMFPAGGLYVPGAERIIPAVGRLNRYARAHGIQVVSDMCAHTENDPEFQVWPPHCVLGTVGQLKPRETILEGNHAVIPARPGEYPIEGAAQIFFQKQELDIGTNPNFRQLLERLAADRYVVYGVVTEYCVRLAALRLLETGKPVSLVTDAIQTLRQEDCDRTFQEFTSRGGKLTAVAAVCTQ
jgi:nicotinamidase/pyrazinamidase